MIRESAKVAIKKAQQRMKHDYLVQQTKEFAIRDQVLYDDSPNYHSKLEPKWVGSWIVVGVLYNRTYKIADHVGVRTQPINGDHLKLF